MPRLLAAILSVLMLAALGVAEASASRRQALVIGNDAYLNVAKLEKAGNDAAAIARTLREVGFEVTEATDLSRREMNAALSSFVSGLGEGDTALLFYAGHGVAIDNRNYLLPVDIPDADTADSGFIEAEALALNDIIDRMKARGTRLNLMVVDACRNNPFSGRATRSLGSGRGLARITAPQGTFVIFSADDGEAALDRLNDDDANPNSVFTRELVPLMRQPGLGLVDMAREVRRRVNTLASTVRHEQTPAYYDAMLGEFAFTAGSDAGSGTSLEPDPQAAAEQEPREVASLPPEPEPAPTRRKDDAAPLAGRAIIVTAGEKDSIRLWDAANASLIARLEGNKRFPTALRIVAGGRRVAVASKDESVRLYELPSFAESGSFDPGFSVSAIEEMADGSLVLGGRDGTLALYDAGTLRQRWRGKPHSGIVSPIIVDEDGHVAITASADGTIVASDLRTGAQVRKVATLPGKAITDIAMVSSSVVLAVHEDGTVAFINGNGAITTSFQGHDGWISSVELLDDATYVTAAVDGTLSFWTIGSQVPLRSVKAHGDVAIGAKRMRFGGASHVISAGFDGALKIWDSGVRRLEADLPHGAAIMLFDYLPQG